MFPLACFFVLLSAYLLFCGVDNTRVFRKLPPVGPKRGAWPLVSVLIPARNEEKRIRPCLESLLKQDYPRYEVLVLDDQSTDGTWGLLRGYSRKDRRLKALKGRPLPAGWVGKPWACHQLSQRARGEWLFFTDADTWHAPDTLKRSVAAAQKERADLLSCMTWQETGTWLEYLVIPVMVFCLISFLPARYVVRRESRFSKFAGAGGQFLFFAKKAYRAIGGHRAVKDRIVEDLAIGNRVVRRGFRLVFRDGTDLTSCRMYSSAAEVWAGFSKNFFPAFKFSFPLALASYAYLFAASVLPFAVLFLAPAGTPVFQTAALLCLLQLFLRLNQAFRYGGPVLSCLLHPVGVLLFILIGLNSMRWYLFLKEGYWKGRVLRPALNREPTEF
jgi:chlorobactene glucosyltransferase